MTPAGQAAWPAGFGVRHAEVRSVVAHLTAGWPRRERVSLFIGRYVRGEADPGVGTQFLISGDGTVHRFIDLPRVTWHATYVNGWSLGVETSNRGTEDPPPDPNWLPASSDPEDIPGAKLWITSARRAHDEVSPIWWTTATYSGPGAGAVGAGRMLFTEWQCRSWALLLRYISEEFGLPRNFPLLPHRTRAGMLRAAADFRRIVLADERAEMMKRAFAAAPINIAAASFEPANAATLQTQYGNAVIEGTGGFRDRNRAWIKYFDLYRGLHGHALSGALRAASNDKSACPGIVFDYHRLARETWDWWWYPFDVDGATTAARRRGYRRFDADTPVLEYFWDESEAARNARVAQGIHGNRASPTTFALDAGSPVYALANGTLVAARFPPEGAGVSLAFALVRHEVFHARRFASVIVFGTEMFPDSIDYGRPPSSVYTLYMHLGRPAGMSLEEVRDDNPDWLNRVLVRKKECDLGVAFYDDDDPPHHGIAAAVWNNRPPGVPRRPTTLEAWRADQAALGQFLDNLRAGQLATSSGQPWVQPIRILLGDFLGESGVIRRAGGVTTRGIRVETFSPTFVPPTFSLVTGQTGWNPPAGRPRPALSYISEWARVPTTAEQQAMTAIGVDPALLGWWQAVSLVQHLDPSLPRAARLPFAGPVIHYQPIDLARWINGVTWKSEWPKYRVTDAAGNAVTPAPARPRTRRV